MAGVALALEVTPDQLARWCGMAAADLGRLDLTPAWRDVSLLLVAAARNNFDQGRSPSGVPWLPLKRPSRRRGGPGSKPLRDTGLLMASYTAQGSGHVEERTPQRLTWGSNVDRAGWHHFGTATIPAREQIGVTQELADKVAMVVADRVARMLAGG
jgi:phage gpG-like protein